MEEINIKDFLDYLKKYIFIIVIVVCLAIVLIFIYDKNIKVPLYKSNTTIVLTQTTPNTETTITQNDLTINSKLVSTYSEIVKSKLVLEQVITDLDLDMTYKELYKKVSVESVQNTEILKISVLSEDASRSAEITNRIAIVFSKEVSKIYQLNNISIVDKAQEAKDVANNTLYRDLFLGIFASIFGMAAIIFVIYYFDDTIKLSDSLEEEIGMPVIAKIFKSDIKSKNSSSQVELLLEKYPKSVVSESIKTLRTNLQFASVDNAFKTILVTSSIPGEGKSFISANLGISFTQTGKKVLIVDCDRRKGRQHRIFKVSNSNGLSNLLIDDIDNIGKYVSKTSIKNLFLITRGTCPPNPSELLNSKKNKELIRVLKERFDIVIFDGVPCNGLPDSIIMSTLVDQVLIVSREGVTPKNILSNTKKSLEKVNASIAGDILNNISKKGSTYGRYYSYYGEENK